MTPLLFGAACIIGAERERIGMGAALGAGTGAKDPVAADARPTGIAIPGAAPAIGGGGGEL